MRAVQRLLLALAASVALSAGALAGDADLGSAPTLDPASRPSVGQKNATGPQAIAVIPAPPGPNDAPPRSIHGAWFVRCDKVAAGEQCALLQSVVGETRKDVGLAVIVLKRPGTTPFMRLVAPLGVLMQEGIGLNIDGQDLGRTSYVKCLPNGCIAEVELDASLIKQLAAGKTATFLVFEAPGAAIGIPIALDGLQSGMAALP